MSTRTDPPKPMFGHDAGSSPGAQPPRLLAISPLPPAAGGLPSTYGVPALELLVVDPANLFISWEITSDQQTAAAAILGDGYGARKLRVDVEAVGNPPELLASTELFGDAGRWFLSVPPVGRLVTARLYFDATGKQHDLLTAGPVSLPRVTPVEPDGFEELHVAYSFGPGGRLSLAGTRRATSEDLPGFAADNKLKEQGAGSPGHGGLASPGPWSAPWPPTASTIPGARDD